MPQDRCCTPFTVLRVVLATCAGPKLTQVWPPDELVRGAAWMRGKWTDYRHRLPPQQSEIRIESSPSFIRPLFSSVHRFSLDSHAFLVRVFPL